MKQMIDIKGRSAWFTGGGRGIGRSSRLRSASPAPTVAVASRSLKRTGKRSTGNQGLEARAVRVFIDV